MYFYIITKGDFEIYYVENDNNIIHTSYVSGKCFKFRFMKKGDIEIGPCYTNKEHRGKGIYPEVLRTICYERKSLITNIYIFVDENNISSIKGIEKSNFDFDGNLKKECWAHIKNQYKRLDVIKLNNMWRYYNHALIPATPPHQSADGDTLENDPLWKEKRVLFARWTSDYDVGYETNWWYCIKDEPFDISLVKSDIRYKINKGLKNFEVNKITPNLYIDELYDVFIKAERTYNINLNKNKKVFESYVTNEKNTDVFGAFTVGEHKLVGYVVVTIRGNCIDYSTHKADPEYEHKQLNAAMVCGVLEYYKERLINEYYICDGERNIYHETRFQDYLEKYFGFRKVYCKLNIKYKPHVKLIVVCLYPFRKVIEKIPKLKKVSAVLKMHELYRQKGM